MDLSKFAVTIEINSSIEKVWQELTNWETQSKWMLLTKVWSQRTTNHLGTKIFAFTGVAPQSFPIKKRERPTQGAPYHDTTQIFAYLRHIALTNAVRTFARSGA